MAKFKLPYYRGHIEYQIPDELVAGVLVSQTENYVPTNTEVGLVNEALSNPIDSFILTSLLLFLLFLKYIKISFSMHLAT